MASCTACVDTSIPVVTDDDRTATPFAGEAWERPSVRSPGVPDNRRCVVIGQASSGSRARGRWPTGAGTSWSWRRGAPGHERSGSKGDARIFRLGYPEAHDVEMALLAQGRWRDLERATGWQLLRVTGR